MLSTPTRPDRAGTRFTPAQWGLLSVLAGNMLIDALEVSVALVALPSIGDDLGLATAGLQWVVSGFAVGFGGLLLFGGRLVAIHGRRPVYLAALLVFAAASLAGAPATSAALLIATRFVKGFCAALTAPTGFAIIASVFPEGPARRGALSVYSLFGASGFSAGLLLSGALTELSWRWTFAFPAPVALLLFGAALRLIPRDEPAAGAKAPRRYDAAGAFALTGAMLALVAALTCGAGRGWDAPGTVVLFVLAALLAAVFVRVELSAPEPLLRLDLLRHGPLLRSALGAGALNGSYLGLLLVVTLRMQRQAGHGPWFTGLAFLPAAAPLAVTALLSGRLVARFGPPRLIAAGAASATLGYALYAAGHQESYVRDLLPTLVLVGVAFVLAFTAFHVQATSSVTPADQPAAGGLYQTSVQLGAAVMTALCAAVLPSGQRPVLYLITAVGLLGLVVALRGLAPGRVARGAARQSPEDER